MGTVITPARGGLLPSARAWQEAEFSLDGSRGFSEGTVCTSVGSVKGINQRPVITARSCTQAVGLRGEKEKVVQADPVRAVVIKEGGLWTGATGVRDISAARNTLKTRTDQSLAFLSLPLSSPATASLWPQRSEARELV